MAHSQKGPIEHAEDDVDLNPLIDIIVMLIVFFILAGRLTTDIRTEQITVPPTKTASKLETPREWEIIVVNVFGNTQPPDGVPPENHIRVGNTDFVSKGIDNFDGYIKFRQLLDVKYDRAAKYDDPKGTGLKLPKILIEVRADANTQYRVIQEVQQLLTDTINPADGMKPKVLPPAQSRPFVAINFTTRLPQKGG